MTDNFRLIRSSKRQSDWIWLPFMEMLSALVRQSLSDPSRDLLPRHSHFDNDLLQDCSKSMVHLCGINYCLSSWSAIVLTYVEHRVCDLPTWLLDYFSLIRRFLSFTMESSHNGHAGPLVSYFRDYWISLALPFVSFMSSVFRTVLFVRLIYKQISLNDKPYPLQVLTLRFVDNSEYRDDDL